MTIPRPFPLPAYTQYNVHRPNPPGYFNAPGYLNTPRYIGAPIVV